MLCCTDANKRLTSLLPFIETMNGPVSGTPRANNVKDIVKTDSNWLSAFTVVSLDTIATTCLRSWFRITCRSRNRLPLPVSNVVIPCSIVPLWTVQSVVTSYSGGEATFLFSSIQRLRKSRKVNLPITKFVVLAEVLLKIKIFCDVRLCYLVTVSDVSKDRSASKLRERYNRRKGVTPSTARILLICPFITRPRKRDA